MKQEQFSNVVGIASATFAITLYLLVEFIIDYWFPITIALMVYSILTTNIDNSNTRIEFNLRIN